MEWFKKKIETEVKKREPIGEGGERVVFPDPQNSERVIGVYKRESGEVELDKIKFYLTKIIHLLFPKNIPDIYELTSSPRTTTRERIETDQTHREAQGTDTLSYTRQGELKQKLRQSPEAEEFHNNLEGLGIYIDKNPKNYSFDSEGDPVYLDDITNWRPDVADKLEVAIRERLVPPDQTRALSLLSRLRELLSQ